MSIDLNIITITNSMHQLNALPVGESVFILFNAKPDINSVKNKINLCRVDDGIIVPFLGDPNAVQMSYVKQTYGSVPFTPKVSQSGLNWLLEIDPNDLLVTNSKYYLFVENGLLPEFYTITKPVTLGNSSIAIEAANGSATSDNYEIIITQTTSLTSGKHLIRYTLNKNSVAVATNVEIDINTTKLTIAPGIVVVFNKNVPFLATERFNISVQASTGTVGNKIQYISTYLDADVIKSEDNPSTRLDYEDINKFYESFGWGNASAPQPQTSISPTLEYVGLNSFLLSFPIDIDETSIQPSSFQFIFSEAFNNYLLSNLELYSTSSKYVVKYKVKNNRQILFKVELDTTNIVPNNDKYLVVEQ